VRCPGCQLQYRLHTAPCLLHCQAPAPAATNVAEKKSKNKIKKEKRAAAAAAAAAAASAPAAVAEVGCSRSTLGSRWAPHARGRQPCLPGARAQPVLDTHTPHTDSAVTHAAHVQQRACAATACWHGHPVPVPLPRPCSRRLPRPPRARRRTRSARRRSPWRSRCEAVAWPPARSLGRLAASQPGAGTWAPRHARRRVSRQQAAPAFAPCLLRHPHQAAGGPDRRLKLPPRRPRPRRRPSRRRS